MFDAVASKTDAARVRARAQREREWLEAEVVAAASLEDNERVQILRDLLRTVDAIRAGKSPEELAREEQARRTLDAPGKERYRALAERLG